MTREHKRRRARRYGRRMHDVHERQRLVGAAEACLNCNGTGFTVIDGARRPCGWDHGEDLEATA